jgi:hypothetical protein
MYDDVIKKLGLGEAQKYISDIGEAKSVILGCTILSFVVA